MKQGIRFIIALLVLVHVSLFVMAAFCQTAHQALSQLNSHTTHDDSAHSDYCLLSCQTISTTPSLVQSTPLLGLPLWNHDDSVAFSFQVNTHVALGFLSPRAPPA